MSRFQNSRAERIYTEGWFDREITTDCGDWWGQDGVTVIREDAQGFVDIVFEGRTLDDAEAYMDEIQAEQDAFEGMEV